jgi:hypothetical protein
LTQGERSGVAGLHDPEGGKYKHIGAVKVAFQTGVDFAVLTKKYGSDSNLPDAAHRYSPGHVTGIEKP